MRGIIESGCGGGSGHCHNTLSAEFLEESFMMYLMRALCSRLNTGACLGVGRTLPQVLTKGTLHTDSDVDILWHVANRT
jgi:hypothetical protein